LALTDGDDGSIDRSQFADVAEGAAVDGLAFDDAELRQRLSQDAGAGVKKTWLRGSQ
jgi:hypothetical protein